MEGQWRLCSNASASEQEPWAIAVNTLKKTLAAAENPALLGANLEGSSWVACSSKNRVEAIAETDGEDDEQCVRPYQVARNINLR